MRISSSLTLLAMFVAAAVSPTGVAAQLVVQGRTMSAKITARRSAARERLTVVLEEQGGCSRSVLLPGSIEKITQAKFSPDESRLVLIGESSAGGTITVIGDRSASPLVDENAFAPAVSPTGRYVAYARFRPRSAPLVSDVYLLLDVMRTPEGQRIIYPTEGEDHHLRFSDFYWVADDVVVFLDYAERARETKVVAIQLSNGDITRVVEKRLDAESFLDASLLDADVAPARAFMDPVVSRRPGTGLEIRLTYRPGSPSLKVRRIDITLW